MRRSNSSGWPVSSACTGASKPSVCADFGTSCTWPSVIMMTPARRSGGVLASALLRSAKRLVPEAVSPVGLDEATQRTCRLLMPASLVSSSRLMAAVCSGRPAIVWLSALVDDDDGDVGEALALLLPQRRVGERQQQRGQRQRAQQGAAAAAHQQQRHQHRRQHRARPEQGSRHHRREIDRPAAHARASIAPRPLPLVGRGLGVGGNRRRPE